MRPNETGKRLITDYRLERGDDIPAFREIGGTRKQSPVLTRNHNGIPGKPAEDGIPGAKQKQCCQEESVVTWGK